MNLSVIWRAGIDWRYRHFAFMCLLLHACRLLVVYPCMCTRVEYVLLFLLMHRCGVIMAAVLIAVVYFLSMWALWRSFLMLSSLFRLSVYFVPFFFTSLLRSRSLFCFPFQSVCRPSVDVLWIFSVRLRSSSFNVCLWILFPMSTVFHGLAVDIVTCVFIKFANDTRCYGKEKHYTTLASEATVGRTCLFVSYFRSFVVLLIYFVYDSSTSVHGLCRYVDVFWNSLHTFRLRTTSWSSCLCTRSFWPSPEWRSWLLEDQACAAYALAWGPPFSIFTSCIFQVLLTSFSTCFHRPDFQFFFASIFQFFHFSCLVRQVLYSPFVDADAGGCLSFVRFFIQFSFKFFFVSIFKFPYSVFWSCVQSMNCTATLIIFKLYVNERRCEGLDFNFPFLLDFDFQFQIFRRCSPPFLHFFISSVSHFPCLDGQVLYSPFVDGDAGVCLLVFQPSVLQFFTSFFRFSLVLFTIPVSSSVSFRFSSFSVLVFLTAGFRARVAHWPWHRRAGRGGCQWDNRMSLLCLFNLCACL